MTNNLTAGGTVSASAFSSLSPLKLQTGTSTRIYVEDLFGNVGIGTGEVNPSARLHVRRDTTGEAFTAFFQNVNATGFTNLGINRSNHFRAPDN